MIDTPISETAIVGAACGMSYLGLRPVAEMQFIDFIACCFNQVTNFVAKSHYRWGAPVPMVLRGPSGGGVHGGPFHSANPEMYFVHTPGLKVVYPRRPTMRRACSNPRFAITIPCCFSNTSFSTAASRKRSRWRLHGADRQGGGSPRGQRPDNRQLRGHGTRRWRRPRSLRKRASRQK